MRGLENCYNCTYTVDCSVYRNGRFLLFIDTLPGLFTIAGRRGPLIATTLHYYSMQFGLYYSKIKSLPTHAHIVAVGQVGCGHRPTLGAGV